MNLTFSNQKQFSSQQVNNLYTSVKWTGYTNDLPKLLRAISKSDLVISAWNGEELVGLIRALTDEETVAYIQDILVFPAYHKQGVVSHSPLNQQSGKPPVKSRLGSFCHA